MKIECESCKKDKKECAACGESDRDDKIGAPDDDIQESKQSGMMLKMMKAVLNKKAKK